MNVKYKHDLTAQGQVAARQINRPLQTQVNFTLNPRLCAQRN
jgi:hypothetical protein